MAQNAISDELKFKVFLGGLPPDSLASAAFSTEMLSEIVEISNSVHKTFQELAIKFCLTTFNFTSTPPLLCGFHPLHLSQISTCGTDHEASEQLSAIAGNLVSNPFNFWPIDILQNCGELHANICIFSLDAMLKIIEFVIYNCVWKLVFTVCF